jgi:hypothetical protein
MDPVAVRALYGLLGGDREAFVELVDSFLDEAPQRLAELRRGADQGDAGLKRGPRLCRIDSIRGALHRSYLALQSHTDFVGRRS